MVDAGVRGTTPYGEWRSTTSAAEAAADVVVSQWVHLTSAHAWWTESRPAEEGRVVLVRRTPGGSAQDVLGAPWNVRNRLCEYGGRPWALAGDRVVFTEWSDQRLYVHDPDRHDPDRPGGRPRPLTPVPGEPHAVRYADPAPGPSGEDVWCVRETITGPRPGDVRRDLVAVPLSGAAATDARQVRVLAANRRFLTGPKPSPDGTHVAWLGWNHPGMPWDGAELFVAAVHPGGSLGEPRRLAGGEGSAVCQVAWDEPGSVLALDDAGGWWNLWRIGLDGTARNLHRDERDHGGALWKIGCSWFTPLGDRRHVVLPAGRPALLDERAGTLTSLDSRVWTGPFSTSVSGHADVLLGVAGGTSAPASVVRLDLRRARAAAPDPGWRCVERTFPGAGGHDVHAIVYPPRNDGYRAPAGDLPPYLVTAHGGPTAHAAAVFDPEAEFFARRGVGVVAVNYRGSTGYGRAYRDGLRGAWGVADVLDCLSVARGLVAEGSADPRRLAVRGGSAGGFTAVRALLAEDSCFRCATAMYPVLDLVHWGSDTHDFEAHYLSTLVGGAERRAERSVHSAHVPRDRPVLLMQGLEDEVCPPEHTRRFADRLTAEGVPVAYLCFEGEQHGFRRAATIAAALEAELAFYAKVLGFRPAGEVPPAVQNMVR